MRSEVLIGAQAFMEDFEKVARKATKSLLVQAMTFEGDDAGQKLIDIMLASPARDKRLLVDSYSKAVINDSFVISPKYLKDKEFRIEGSDQ
jgi:cardiolipin synthase